MAEKKRQLDVDGFIISSSADVAFSDNVKKTIVKNTLHEYDEDFTWLNVYKDIIKDHEPEFNARKSDIFTVSVSNKLQGTVQFSPDLGEEIRIVRGIRPNCNPKIENATDSDLQMRPYLLTCWHVRTKKNIERVRKDEEKAAEEEKERQRKIALAEQEARTDQLRVQAKKRRGDELEAPGQKRPKLQAENSAEKHPELHEGDNSGAVTASSSKETDVKETDIYTSSGHINFFKSEEAGEVKSGKNKEHEEEKKAEKEKWEKDIGLLTYLGQSAVEAQENLPWYLSKRDKEKEQEKDTSYGDIKDKWRKDQLDPMVQMSAFVAKINHTDKHKDKHRDKHKDRHIDKYRDRHIDKITDRHKDNITDSHKNRQLDDDRDSTFDKYKDKHLDKNTDKHNDKNTDRHTDKQTDKLKEKQEERHSDKHTKRHKDKHKDRHKEKHKKKNKDKKRKDKYKEKHRKNKHKKKDKKEEPEPKKHSTATKTIQELRAERLRREQDERKRAETLLLGKQGQGQSKEVTDEPVSERDRGYNAAFNPEFSRKRRGKRAYDLDEDSP